MHELVWHKSKVIEIYVDNSLIDSEISDIGAFFMRDDIKEIWIEEVRRILNLSYSDGELWEEERNFLYNNWYEVVVNYMILQMRKRRVMR